MDLRAGLLGAALFAPFQRAKGSLRALLTAGMVARAGFVVFLCTVDAPMYVSRWLADELRGRQYRAGYGRAPKNALRRLRA